MNETQTEFNSIFKSLLSGEVNDPNQLSKWVIQLSAYLFTLDKNRTEAEIAYAKVWEARRTALASDKSCEMALRSSEEYKALENAKSSYRMCRELVMSAKKRLSVLSDMSRGNY